MKIQNDVRYSLQLRSSDMSPQSMIPSQIQPPGIQRLVLAHWNWSGLHAAQSQWYITHAPHNGRLEMY